MDCEIGNSRFRLAVGRHTRAEIRPRRRLTRVRFAPHGCRINAEQRNDAKCHEETSAARVAVAAAVSCSAASDTIAIESRPPPPPAHERNSTTRGKCYVVAYFER